jgi:hypothetical protein
MTRAFLFLPVPLLALMLGSACTPKVAVEAKEPITINLNVNIDHRIRVQVDEELEDKIFNGNSDLF